MIFLIIPENQDIMDWKSILDLCGNDIKKVYESFSRIDFYRLFLTVSEDKFKLAKLKFKTNLNLSLKFDSEEIFEDLVDDEVDSNLEQLFLDMDKKKCLCIIDKSMYFRCNKFMDKNLKIQLYRFPGSKIEFQLIDTKIVPYKEWDKLKKENKIYGFRSILTV